ncbi:MAG: O-acetyl-ADP-ribose deacetylase [Desulfobacterales bacterium]|nr:O-acetyl-ADP-ribose deacetylase [Desulfobacterales bacterium]
MTNIDKRIQIKQCEITELKVDAIVNAANSTLLGGGGVDGAIHKAAGALLLEECKTLNGCKTGEAKITKGYNLAAKHVIHTVGPVWKGGNYNEKELLSKAYQNVMATAQNHKIKTIAFPNISTGVYGFPKDLAAKIAINEVNKFLKTDSTITKVLFVCFNKENYNIYNTLILNKRAEDE